MPHSLLNQSENPDQNLDENAKFSGLSSFDNQISPSMTQLGQDENPHFQKFESLSVDDQIENPVQNSHASHKALVLDENPKFSDLSFFDHQISPSMTQLGQDENPHFQKFESLSPDDQIENPVQNSHGKAKTLVLDENSEFSDLSMTQLGQDENPHFQKFESLCSDEQSGNAKNSSDGKSDFSSDDNPVPPFVTQLGQDENPDFQKFESLSADDQIENPVQNLDENSKFSDLCMTQLGQDENPHFQKFESLCSDEQSGSPKVSSDDNPVPPFVTQLGQDEKPNLQKFEVLCSDGQSANFKSTVLEVSSSDLTTSMSDLKPSLPQTGSSKTLAFQDFSSDLTTMLDQNLSGNPNFPVLETLSSDLTIAVSDLKPSLPESTSQLTQAESPQTLIFQDSSSDLTTAMLDQNSSVDPNLPVLETLSPDLTTAMSDLKPSLPESPSQLTQIENPKTLTFQDSSSDLTTTMLDQNSSGNPNFPVLETLSSDLTTSMSDLKPSLPESPSQLTQVESPKTLTFQDSSSDLTTAIFPVVEGSSSDLTTELLDMKLSLPLNHSGDPKVPVLENFSSDQTTPMLDQNSSFPSPLMENGNSKLPAFEDLSSDQTTPMLDQNSSSPSRLMENGNSKLPAFEDLSSDQTTPVLDQNPTLPPSSSPSFENGSPKFAVHPTAISDQNPQPPPSPLIENGNSQLPSFEAASSDQTTPMLDQNNPPSPSPLIDKENKLPDCEVLASDQTTPMSAQNSPSPMMENRSPKNLDSQISSSDQTTPMLDQNPSLPPLPQSGNSETRIFEALSSDQIMLDQDPPLPANANLITQSFEDLSSDQTMSDKNSTLAPSLSPVTENGNLKIQSLEAPSSDHTTQISNQKPPLPPSPLPLTPNDNPKTPSSKALSSKSSKTAILDQKSRRRSPRLLDSAEEDSSERSKPPAKRKKTALLDQKSGRRSPRLLDSDEENSRERSKPPAKRQKTSGSSMKKRKIDNVSFFIGDSVPDEEARQKWPWRYEVKGLRSKRRTSLSNNDDDDDELVLNVKCHYSQAEIAKCVFNLGDCAYVKGSEKGRNYVGKILEFFETMDGESYFRVQWFFRAEDTVIQDEATSHDKKRLFYSTTMNDNLLDCIVSKVKVVQIPPSVNLKSKSIPHCDFYFDMKYSVEYSTFSTSITDSSSMHSSPMKEIHTIGGATTDFEETPTHKKLELALLDLYSGCGGMSTGLCLGAKLSGANLVTKWAVEIDSSASESLKLNHPETQIRNESTEDFLDLLREWDKLCKRYAVDDVGKKETKSKYLRATDRSQHSKSLDRTPTGEYEVLKLVDICYDASDEKRKRGLKFKVRWVGYGPSEDTWEPIEELRKCQDHIRDFVLKGLKAKILPRPGDVDVICGGPPCQGISGYNRFRNVDSPLDDERNHQIVVFMDIIKFLMPKYVLMENVSDILKFADGCLGRYALSRLVNMNYQARLGIMAAGCYGLPQFRLRVFLWGAHPQEKLPQFPLPTHDVVLKYGAPCEFERNVVAYDEGQSRDLEKAIFLGDAISDLPPVTNGEVREKMAYKTAPETDFQSYIRATKSDMMGLASSSASKKEKPVLYDHRPLPLSEDDYQRVCKVPHRKGANFRDLPGVVVGDNNVVQRTDEPALMPSGKQWVPEYAINFCQGKSKRPFGRLWWDETVPTVLCYPDAHCTAILHPEQDRILTLRECARLQGFHDYYQFCGDLKERYCQVGNAVAVPVGRALGYALGMAVGKRTGDEPLMTLPPKFAHSTTIQLLQSSSNEV